jgi:hypothetical protein
LGGGRGAKPEEKLEKRKKSPPGRGKENRLRGDNLGLMISR